ncbi:MAG: complement resistance protein TraT, partial [Betaproteobacteria bacterium]|nr:complement resistance protein TraT [Betaproteobacteria bacterium]
HTGALTGGLIGGAAAGIVDVAVNSAVKDVTYSMITDVMVSEKAGKDVSETRQSNIASGRGSTVSQHMDKKSGRVRYATRIGTSANKVNLTFEEAQPTIEENLARSIAGIF